MRLSVMQRISASFTAEEIKQVGDGLVDLVGVLKKLTKPQALSFIDKAAELPGVVDVSRAKNPGPFGMMRAMSNDDLKEAIGITAELTKGLSGLKT